MVLKIGDKILYEDESKNGEYLHGTIIAVSRKHAKDIVINYLVQLDSGKYFHINSHNIDRCKLDGPIIL